MCVAISLVALALGYKVFADASKEKEGIKLLGQVIGLVVMIASVLTLICGTAKCIQKSSCAMMSGGPATCPMMAKAGHPMGPQSSEAER